MLLNTSGSNPLVGPKAGSRGDQYQYKLNMEVKFKRLSDKAVLPIRAHKGDAGLDLTCTSINTAINECGQIVLVYHTGLAVEIPEGYVGLLFPRSSIYKKSLSQTNSVGVIDAGYRGEIMAVFRTTTDVVPSIYKEGERFCQLVIMPIPEFDVIETDTLSNSERSGGGFGSSDTTNISAANGTSESSGNEDMSKNSEAATEQAAGEIAPEQAQ